MNLQSPELARARVDLQLAEAEMRRRARLAQAYRISRRAEQDAVRARSALARGL